MTEQKIGGLLSPVDCFIHIFVPRENKQEWVSTVIHEYIHYIQIVATPVGSQIRLRQQWLAVDIFYFLGNLPQPITLGVHGLKLQSGNYTEKESKGFDFVWNHILSRFNELKYFYKPFFTMTAKEFFKECFPSTSADKGYKFLRETRPIEIDPQNGCFYLKTTGSRLTVGANSIMEYMAHLAELYVDLRFTDQKSLFELISDESKAFYNIPLIFLVQEGIFESPYGIAPFLTMMMIIMQLSLLIDPLTLTSELESKYSIDRDSFLPETIFLRCLSEPNLFDPSVFLFNKIRSAKTAEKPTPNRDYADFVLSEIGWPSINELLSCFKHEIEKNISLATNMTIAQNAIRMAHNLGTSFQFLCEDTLLPKAQLRKKQFRTFLDLCFTMWENDDAIANPITFFEKVPPPIFAELKEEGLAFSCMSPNQDFWDVHFEFAGTLAFHLGQKILYSNELSCYNDPFGMTALFACPFVNECVAITNKEGLEFCMNSSWRNLVEKILREMKIQIS